MKKYDITITFTLNENDYKRYDKNIDNAMDLILPYGADYDIKKNRLYRGGLKMADRKPSKGGGICTIKLYCPTDSITAKLDRCERVCEHYSYCQYVAEMNEKLKEMEQ